MSVLVFANAAAGQQSAALQMLEKPIGADRSILSGIGARSSVCSGLGDKDRAFELMEKALAVEKALSRGQACNLQFITRQPSSIV